MVADIQPDVTGMKTAYNELRDSVGKIPVGQLQSKIDTCTDALKRYDSKVTPLKKAMAANKPKKAKVLKAKAAPQSAAVAAPGGPAS